MHEESAELLDGMSPIVGDELLLDRVADAIRTAILSGQLPPGTRLSVPELSRRLQVSRTPAREALFRLQAEGLVSVAPRRGAIVIAADPEDLVELFEYREGLEGMAARLAALRMDDGQKQELQKAFDAHAEAVAADDIAAHVETDRRFHEVLINGSGNRRIIDELAKIRSQLALLTMRMSAKEGALDHVVEAHRAILDGVLAGDARRAENATRIHVRKILEFYRNRA